MRQVKKDLNQAQEVAFAALGLLVLLSPVALILYTSFKLLSIV